MHYNFTSLLHECNSALHSYCNNVLKSQVSLSVHSNVLFQKLIHFDTFDERFNKEN